MKYLLLIAILSSCSSLKSDVSVADNQVIIQAVNKVAMRQYKMHVDDCSNFAFDVALELDSKGYDVRIFCYMSTRTMAHAIVELHIGRRVYYIDPTAGVGRWMVRNPKKKPLMIFTIKHLMWMKNKNFNDNILNDFMRHLK